MPEGQCASCFLATFCLFMPLHILVLLCGPACTCVHLRMHRVWHVLYRVCELSRGVCVPVCLCMCASVKRP